MSTRAAGDDEDGEKPKCGLLAMLPKPKSSAPTSKMASSASSKQQKLTTTATPATKIPKLPASMMAMRPRQAASATKTPATMAEKILKTSTTYDSGSDDEDEEFDARLAAKLKEQKMDGNEEEDDSDSSGPEEGPARPPQMNNGQKLADPQQNRITLNRPLGIDYGDSSSENEDDEDEQKGGQRETEAKSAIPGPEQSNTIDFFGLTESPPSPKRSKMEGEEQPMLDTEPRIFIDDVAPGPSRPVRPPVAEQIAEEQRQQKLSRLRAISDQEAHRLIYEKELAPYGANPFIATDAVNQLVDVSVDSTLGPNIRENLLKNLSGKQMAQLPLTPMPKVKKSEGDRLAKRKHQITHLAAVAVSREEQLQEKWAEGKQNKKMSRQKYGF